jgi:predicted ATPase
VRLIEFQVSKVGPLKLVHVSQLANVVVLAGPNGVGKTNIINAILQLARNVNSDANLWMIVQATDEQEKITWGKSLLDTRSPQDAVLLRTHLQRNQRRNKYNGSFLNFDSDRAVRNVQQYNFSWDIGDPYAEDIGWDIGLQSLQNRYNEVRHSLFRLVESQRRDIADRVISMQQAGAAQMPLDFPDVIKPFKDAFWQLLAPKRLVEVSTRSQQIFYEYNGTRLNLDTLSSGEKEVVNVVFDFLLRGPQHCTVLFDEPELHLHPELSYKLLQTLSSIGTENQFVFSTHSPEIISASLENTVVFISPPRGEADNQAIIVNRDDQTHQALQTLGQSIGVISLGKKLILVEGEETSLDKQTYGAILQSNFPEFVLVPVGGKDSVRSFEEVRENILNRTIWGVEFYLLCDRDAVNQLGPKAIAATPLSKIKQLPRYHLENYFLDEFVIASIFESFEPANCWLRSPPAIRQKLKEIALTVVSYATSLNVSAAIREAIGNVSLMPKGVAEAKSPDDLATAILARATNEALRVSAGLDPPTVRSLIVAEYERLNKAIQEDSDIWLRDLPGRVILNKFAAAANLQPGRLKQAYLANADKSIVFADIVRIFQQFRDGH